MHDVDLPPSPKQSELVFTVGGTAASVSSQCSQKQPHVAHLSWTNHISVKAVWSPCSSLNVES